jgi:hypothetical protein
VGEAGAPAVRSFLIADVRGYTRFTQLNGDEQAGQLAAAFALPIGIGLDAGEAVPIEAATAVPP